MKAGDLVEMSFAGASWIGLVITVNPDKSVEVYRGESLGLQVWPLEDFYNLRVLYESR